MNNITTNQTHDPRVEKLKKQQKKIRIAGFILIGIGTITMPFLGMIHYTLVGISAISATIGGFMVARSFVHFKYRNLK